MTYVIGRRRGRLEIKLQLLAAAVEPVPRTVLMYRTNLSWRTVRELVRELVDKGLLAEVDPADVGRWRPAIGSHEPRQGKLVRVLIVTTEQGRNLLATAKELMGTLLEA